MRFPVLFISCIARHIRLNSRALSLMIVLLGFLFLICFVIVPPKSAWTSRKKQNHTIANRFEEDPIFKLDAVMDSFDKEVIQEAGRMKKHERSVAHAMTLAYIHKDFTPASPAEYIFPLHSPEVLLRLQLNHDFKICMDWKRSDVQESSITHPYALVRKLDTPSNIYLQMSLSPSHPFAQHCSAVNEYWTALGTDCLEHMYHEIMREAIFRQELSLDFIVKLCGYCYSRPSPEQLSPSSAAIIVEYGTPLSVDELAQTSFTNRLYQAANLAELLIFLETSKYGSIFVGDVSEVAFVLVGKRVKLFDLSSLNTIEPYCSENEDCSLSGEVIVNCAVSDVCVGFNAVANLFKFNQLFFSALLEDTKDVPPRMIPGLVALRSGASRLVFTAQELHYRLRSLLSQLPASPSSREPTAGPQAADYGPAKLSYSYAVYVDSDLHGRHDYMCPRTRADWGCAMAIHTIEKAEEICSADWRCKAFVAIPNQRRKFRWYTVIFKSGVDSKPDTKEGATLHVKHPRGGREFSEPSLPPPGIAQVPFAHQYTLPTDPPVVSVLSDGEDQPMATAATSDPDSTSSDTTIAAVLTEECRAELVPVYASMFQAMERSLMATCGWADMTDRRWMHSMLAGAVSSVSSVELQESSMVVLDVDLATDESTVLVSMVASSDWSALKPFIVFLVDRLLGFYLTPPATVRMLHMSEANGAVVKDYLQDILPPLPTVNQEHLSLWAKLNVALLPKVLSNLELGQDKLTLNNWSVDSEFPEGILSREEERREMSFRILSWLTGTESLPDQRIVADGRLVRVGNEHSFKPDVLMQKDDLEVFHLCRFPRHVVEHLEAALERKGCSLSSQIRRVLEVNHFIAALGPQSLENRVLLDILHYVDSATARLMEVVGRCYQAFGRSAVLVDMSRDFM